MWFPVEFGLAEVIYPVQIGVTAQSGAGQNFSPFSKSLHGVPGAVLNLKLRYKTRSDLVNFIPF